MYTLTENHRGGTDRVTHTYDFVGNLMARTHEHRGSGNDLTLRETYRYDHADRLLEVQHQTNDGGAVTVARYEYNELGEVIEEKPAPAGQRRFRSVGRLPLQRARLAEKVSTVAIWLTQPTLTLIPGRLPICLVWTCYITKTQVAWTSSH